MDDLMCPTLYKRGDESVNGNWSWYDDLLDVVTDNYGKEGDLRWLGEL